MAQDSCPRSTRCGGDNGGSCLPCARSRPHAPHRDLLTSPATARRRAVGAAAPGECPAMVRGVSPTASPLPRHVSTQVSRAWPASAVSGARRAAAIRRPRPRNPPRTGNDAAADYPSRCSPQPAPWSSALRTTRWRPTNTDTLSGLSGQGTQARPAADVEVRHHANDLLRQSLTPPASRRLSGRVSRQPLTSDAGRSIRSPEACTNPLKQLLAGTGDYEQSSIFQTCGLKPPPRITTLDPPEQQQTPLKPRAAAA